MLEKALEKSKLDTSDPEIEDLEPPQSEDKVNLIETEPSALEIKETNFPSSTASIDSKKSESQQNKTSTNHVKFNWQFLKDNGFICPGDADSRLAEEYRSIKRPLVTNALGARKQDIENSNLILITSSIPGEGKTFTSINLSLSIAAELDKKVLLIDADVAKPSISKVLEIKNDIGLIDYLENDNLTLSDIILQTDIPGLRIITSGKSHQLSTELLASNKMIALSRELSERYADRIVIFDTPPLLATTQAEVLAAQMGQIVLVVGAETTPQNFVMESVAKLTACSDVVLTLLNKAQRDLNADYYGYGHY